MILTRDLIFFDAETTGVNAATDKIVELSATKLFKTTGTKQTKTWRINPEIEIPKGASDVHGITNEDVVLCPKFKEVAPEVYHFFKDCDLAGFNSDEFDIPLMLSEFKRAGFSFLDWEHETIDVLKLHRKKNPNTLSALYKIYTGEELENAHNANNDVVATETILSHILDIHFEKTTTSSEIANLIQGDKKKYDIAGKLYLNKENIVCWNFGKFIDKPINHDIGFLNWVLAKDFPEQTKELLKEIINK